MKNKYIVVDANGVEYDPENYIKNSECPEEFRILVEREALGVPPSANNQNSNYLKIANKLGFRWEQNADIGFLQYDQDAQLIMELVQRYARQLVQNLDMPIYEVRGSNFFDMDHPSVEAYAGLFGERLFKHKSKKKELVMSYDGSYPQFNLAKQYNIREEHLPIAHFSLADCYRYEQSGECMLLLRQRRFYMPDLHPYYKDVAQAWKGYEVIERKILESAAEVNIGYWNVAKISSESNWIKYKPNIKEIASRRNMPILVEIRRDKADRYWIIDVDYSFIDKYQQVREIGCIQIDIGNASRLGISYLAADGKQKHPVIIHSAVPGGIERYIYAILDDFRNRMPFWLYPVQVRLIPVSEKYVSFAEQLVAQLGNSQLRIEIDDRAESVSKRIKMAHKDLVAEPIVIGENEEKNPEVILDKLNSYALRNNNFPYLALKIPNKLSQRIMKI